MDYTIDDLQTLIDEAENPPEIFQHILDGNMEEIKKFFESDVDRNSLVLRREVNEYGSHESFSPIFLSSDAYSFRDFASLFYLVSDEFDYKMFKIFYKNGLIDNYNFDQLIKKWVNDGDFEILGKVFEYIDMKKYFTSGSGFYGVEFKTNYPLFAYHRPLPGLGMIDAEILKAKKLYHSDNKKLQKLGLETFKYLSDLNILGGRMMYQSHLAMPGGPHVNLNLQIPDRELANYYFTKGSVNEPEKKGVVNVPRKVKIKDAYLYNGLKHALRIPGAKEDEMELFIKWYLFENEFIPKKKLPKEIQRVMKEVVNKEELFNYVVQYKNKMKIDKLQVQEQLGIPPNIEEAFKALAEENAELRHNYKTVMEENRKMKRKFKELEKLVLSLVSEKQKKKRVTEEVDKKPRHKRGHKKF